MSSKWRKVEKGSTPGKGIGKGKTEENFSRKSNNEIRDKPRFKKGLFHQDESSSSKGHHDRNSKSRVKRNNEIDTPQERPP